MRKQINIESRCTNCGWKKDLVITIEIADEIINKTNIKVLGLEKS